MIEYAIILTIILLSGSILGWAVPGISIVQMIIVPAYFFYKKWRGNTTKILLHKKNLITFLIILFAYTTSIVFISRLNPLSFWNIYLTIISCFFVAESIERERFIRKYINIILFLSAMSVIFWFLAQFGVEVGAKVIDPGNGNLYRMNPLYIYRDFSKGTVAYGMNARNFGIFWEGGAFQAFVNLGLFFLIRNKGNETTTAFLMKACVLVVTIVSTFSTMGYLLLIINLLVYMHSYTGKNSKKRFIFFIVLIFVAIFILSTPAVVNKFSSDSDSYISFIIRLNDNINGLKIMFMSPILGWGYNSLKYMEILRSYGIYGNSSGLLIVAQQFGIFYFIWYTYRQCKNFTTYLNKTSIWGNMLCFLFLILIFASENLNQNQLFMLFAYEIVGKEVREVNQEMMGRVK